jgi:hypothetical protein
MVWKNFRRLQESRQNMVTLHSEILKVAETFPKECIHDRMACLPKIAQAITDKEGGRTKY